MKPLPDVRIGTKDRDIQKYILKDNLNNIYEI